MFNTDIMAMILPFLGRFFCFLTCCSLFLQIIGKYKPHAAGSEATKEFNESRHFKQSRGSMVLVPGKQTEKAAVCSTYNTVLMVNNLVGRNVAQRGRSSLFFFVCLFFFTDWPVHLTRNLLWWVGCRSSLTSLCFILLDRCLSSSCMRH